VKKKNFLQVFFEKVKYKKTFFFIPFFLFFCAPIFFQFPNKEKDGIHMQWHLIFYG